MQATLGKLLVDQGGIAPERLDLAVRQSVLHGGRLDTHLLEMGLIDEARLTELMAQAYEIAPADFRALVKVDLSALRLLPSRVAERCQVFPFLLEGESLHVLAPAPPDRQLLEEIGEMVHKQITPHLATEYRIARALAHYYGLEIPDRFVVLEKALAGNEHARVDPQSTENSSSPAPQVAESVIEQHRWTLSEALTRLSAVGDRDAVVQITLSYAASFVDCAAVLGVQAGRVIGWQGVGGDLDNAQLRSLQVATEPPSALRTVIETSAPFIGALDDREVHRSLLASLHRSRVRSVLLYPVLVAGRVVALVYGDNASRPLRTSSMGDFLAFCSRIGSAFENIILARKQVRVDKVEELGGDAVERTSEPSVDLESDREPAAQEQRLITELAEAETSLSSPPDRSSTASEHTWTVQVDAASDLGSLEVVVSDPPLPPQAPPRSETVSRADLRSPADNTQEGHLVTAPAEPPKEELESWDDEVREALGTAGVEPSFLPSATMDHGRAPLAATSTDDLQPGDDLAAALREAEQTVAEHEISLKDEDSAHPDEESIVFDEAIHQEGALTGVASGAVAPVPTAAPVPDLNTDEDELHPDEESVLFDDAEHGDEAEAWQQALNTTIETDHQGGQHAIDAAAVFATSKASVALDEVLEHTVNKAQGTDPTVDETALELGTPRQLEDHAAPVFSQTELNQLCDQLAGPERELAHAAGRKLRAADMRVAPMLAARFPGHVAFDPFGQDWHIPEPDELSSLMGFLAQQPAFGSEVALTHLDSSFPALRWYAVYLFKCVHDARAIKAIMPRLHDEEPRIRHLTAEVLRGYSATAGFDLVIRHLRKRLKSPVAEVRRRAIYFLGFFKDVSSVPHLISCLAAREPELVAEASQALAAITLQTLGPAQRRWLKWWDKNQIRSRVEWLIDGLRHKDRNIRYAASVELTGIAHETFGYDYDGKKRDREKAVKQWERWWKGERKRMHLDT